MPPLDLLNGFRPHNAAMLQPRTSRPLLRGGPRTLSRLQPVPEGVDADSLELTGMGSEVRRPRRVSRNAKTEIR